jgi:hypothetical protein
MSAVSLPDAVGTGCGRGSQAFLSTWTVNGVLVPDGLVGGTNTIAYCRDIGPTTVVLRAVDTSGNRSGPSNALSINC